MLILLWRGREGLERKGGGGTGRGRDGRREGLNGETTEEEWIVSCQSLGEMYQKKLMAQQSGHSHNLSNGGLCVQVALDFL